MNQLNIDIKNQSVYYLNSLGWSVIPVGRNKKPLIDWKEYQSRKPTLDELNQWFNQFPDMNIAVVTGKISNLVVVDIDPRHGGTDKEFNRVITVKAKTGGGGSHFYFQYEEGITNQVGIRPGVDIRAEGGFIVLPPSIHESGNHYQWVMSPQARTPILPLPTFVKDWLKRPEVGKDKTSNWDGEVLSGVNTGSRNDSAASVAGKLLSRFPEDEWESEAWPLLQAWNSRNNPPLGEDELRLTFESIKKKEQSNQEKKKKDTDDTPVALKIVEEIHKEQILLFHDQYKEGFIATKGDGREILKLRSKSFKQYLSRHVYVNSGKIITSDTLNNVIQVLEGQALFDGLSHELQIRITNFANAIWYDIGTGSVVHIDSSGWRITDNPPILFRRISHQQQQVLPVSGGNIKDLLRFVNIKQESEKLLFLVYVVSSFIPGFAHPILVFFGPQGSGKTTPHKLLKSLIDPSEIKGVSAPDSIREFIQFANHHYFFFLDNLSSLPDWLSDALARACTGDGFSKRELYSDDDDVICSFQRVIGLNGIPLVVEKADLLDRSILLGQERIPKDKRQTEEKILNEFEKAKPYLLGAIFDAVFKALNEYPNISLSSYPRMADFASWGCAIARAIGYKDEEFLTAYNNNISQQNDAAIDASPIGTCVDAYMENHESWEGTASELFEMLEKQAEELKINTKGLKKWPKEPSWLVRRLQEVQSNLAEKGIRFERDEKARPKRIYLQKIKENADASDDGDGLLDLADKKDQNNASGENDSSLNSDGDGDGIDKASQSSASETTASSSFTTTSQEENNSLGDKKL